MRRTWTRQTWKRDMNKPGTDGLCMQQEEIKILLDARI
jgi:hypothetical protein